MNFEKEMKKMGNKNLDKLTPNLYEKPKTFPLWAKLAIPIGSVALASALAISIIIPNMRSRMTDPLSAVQLVKASVTKVSDKCDRNMSQATYDSYSAFAKKFSSLMMEVNNKEKEDSLAISIPDAYLCLAITGVISDNDARNDILNYLELPSMDALRTSVKEVLSTMATLFRNQEGKLVGGYNLNSIWLNPEKVHLIKEKDEELYNDLAEIFDASLYFEALTSKNANQYLKENGLKDMPTPEIKLNDEDPSAMNVMSVFYCLDYFDQEAKEFYKQQYESRNHLMDFTYNGKTEKVDYIERTTLDNVYEGNNFYGSSMGIGNLQMQFFLPNEKTALPSSIFDDVVNENYHLRETTYIDIEENELPTTCHNVHLSAPYFSLDNEATLERGDLRNILPQITQRGAGERLAKSNDGYPMYLDYVVQFSKMKFNYDGFYSCSVTIAGYDAESAIEPRFQDFDLTLDHPYVFEVTKMIGVGGNTYKNVPMIIGEIVTPTYED